MIRIFATIKKEYLTLTRDKAGLALLFFMPLVLIIMMALIQDAPFKDYQELKFKIVLVDNDDRKLSDELVNGLEQAKKFSITRTYEKKPITDVVAKKLVNEGEFQFAIIIPKGTTQQVENNSNYVVSKLLNSLGLPTDTNAFKRSNQLHLDIIF